MSSDRANSPPWATRHSPIPEPRRPAGQGADGDPGGPDVVRLTVLGEFVLHRGGVPVAVSAGEQRLLAFLAVHDQRSRRRVATALWPDHPQPRALGNLRTTLWRLERNVPGAVLATRHNVELGSHVSADVWDLAAIAGRLRSGAAEPGWELERVDLPRGELLPGWHEDWVRLERERIRQLQVRVLEAITDHHLRLRRYGEALTAAREAVALEPFRDSAHAAVIRVHLGEGSLGQAVRHYLDYRDLLRSELGIAPTGELYRLIATYVREASSDVTGG